jgi:hypothetical protein
MDLDSPFFPERRTLMLTPQGRYPTPEEVEAIMARARRMRSEYVAALIVSAALRARQFFSRAREQRATSARRFHPDLG